MMDWPSITTAEVGHRSRPSQIAGSEDSTVALGLKFLALFDAIGALKITEGDIVAEVAIANARSVLKLLGQVDFLPSRIMASVDGGITICFIVGDRYSDIECVNSGEILAVISDRSSCQSPDVWDIGGDHKNLHSSIERIRYFLQ